MSLPYSVYNTAAQRLASCNDVESAAALCAIYGTGSTIRYQGRIVWREGKEDIAARESHALVASTVHNRIHANSVEAYDKVNGAGAAEKVLKKREAEGTES